MSTSTPPTTYLNTELRSPTLPLLLRTPLPTDAPAIHALLTNPLNTALDKSESYGAPPPPTLADISSRITTWREAAASPLPQRLNLVVVDLSVSKRITIDSPELGIVVGLGGFGWVHTLEDGRRSGNVGIMLSPEARGKGFGGEAIRLAVEWGFEVCGFEEESLGMLERNRGMMKIVERVLVPMGWKGEERKLLENGEWECNFKISREEWLRWKAENRSAKN
jgi:RimJ/RimL family protein N-acetyltransferase